MTEETVLKTPGYLIARAARGFARLSEARLRPLGFGVGAVPVLVTLREMQPTTQRDLARRLRVEQPPMAQMLARLERDGLIERRVDPGDTRSRLVTLTKAADVRLPEAIGAVMRGNAEALAGFTEEEEAQLIVLLERAIANLDRLSMA